MFAAGDSKGEEVGNGRIVIQCDKKLMELKSEDGLTFCGEGLHFRRVAGSFQKKLGDELELRRSCEVMAGVGARTYSDSTGKPHFTTSPNLST